MRADWQQRAWDKAARAYRKLETTLSELRMVPNEERCYDLEHGIACAMETMVMAANMQREKETREKEAQTAPDDVNMTRFRTARS